MTAGPADRGRLQRGGAARPSTAPGQARAIRRTSRCWRSRQGRARSRRTLLGGRPASRRIAYEPERRFAASFHHACQATQLDRSQGRTGTRVRRCARSMPGNAHGSNATSPRRWRGAASACWRWPRGCARRRLPMPGVPPPNPPACEFRGARRSRRSVARRRCRCSAALPRSRHPGRHDHRRSSADGAGDRARARHRNRRRVMTGRRGSQLAGARADVLRAPSTRATGLRARHARTETGASSRRRSRPGISSR